MSTMSMSPDLHPEELFDKSIAGELTEQERDWLDSHLKQCAVCRFEMQARKDFDAVPMAALSVDNVVARALAGMPTSAPAPTRRRRDLRGYVAIAAVMSAMASFAAVRYSDGIRVIVARVMGNVEVPMAPLAPSVSPRGSRHLEALEKDLPPPPPPPQEEAQIAPPNEPTPEPAIVPVQEHHVSQVKVAMVRREELPPPAPVASALDLFTAANHARSSGQAAEATRGYRELVERYPAAPESKLSHALLGRLLLDTADAAAAVTELEAYLRSGDDTLREEALAARAMAYGRLGKADSEAGAWAELLEGFPDSIHAERARTRLEELRIR